MARLFRRFLSGNFIIVLSYAIFVMFSLLLQCLIPFLQTFSDLVSISYIIPFLNQKFVLPIDIITSLWTAISAGYVGLDRGMFALDGLKNGTKIEAFSETKRKHMIHIIFLSFFIYLLAVGLNIIFNASLALTPLATAFGSTVLCYVLGNKVIGGAQKLHPEDDLDQDGIKDEDQYNKDELRELREKYAKLQEISSHSQCIMHGQLTGEQQASLAQMIASMKSGKQISAITTSDGKIVFREVERPVKRTN
jgi:hypothetical protein